MRWTSLLAIYFLFWFLSLFLVLPFGIRTTDEVGGEKIPGQADSAPHEFRPLRIVLRTSLVALALFALFYANYSFGWITTDTLRSWFHGPAEANR
ncbi:DUF1467 family protein [Sphingobium nicotianae]|uniref:DUF1467 family protein n=1 Tax=Sphingobium nicotianae TaxID=2782607 RepID=A0A9X1AI16_9SPHN|nr:DUF1467 family protein [Sphingobium nicotianae]MBT2185501.1 DUF1467 family protein [Sphingobium nicotianae]